MWGMGAIAKPQTYADAGVDIDAGNALVKSIAPLAKSTARRGADGALGGFGGLFDLAACDFKDPILVAANDGVGTKLKIAIEAGKHTSIGIDLVAMCVNDLIVQGAEPLFFLDYYATSALDVATAHDVIDGIAQGCKQAGCALIGGETAEMPGLYNKGDYDLAGFAVGAAERSALLPRTDIKDGDVLLGIASSGLHANGFSLIRKLVAQAGLAWDAPDPTNTHATLAEALLVPTRIYVRALLPHLERIKGLVHITGGGFQENLPRALPDGLGCEIDRSAWQVPEIFQWVQASGEIAWHEMFRTFNCGIGMVAIVAAEDAAQVAESLHKAGEEVVVIGGVVDNAGGGDSVGFRK